jgi:hypothetical protein
MDGLLYYAFTKTMFPQHTECSIVSVGYVYHRHIHAFTIQIYGARTHTRIYIYCVSMSQYLQGFEQARVFLKIFET